MKKITKFIFGFLILMSFSSVFSGCKKGTVSKADEKAEIQVFIAASLNKAMTQIAQEYNKTNPNVQITFNADSSGTLMTQIREGYSCDVFFSAAQKQMDTLEKEGFLIDGTRKNVLNNQLVIIALKDSETKVTGLENLEDAASIALAAGSVPAGKYTRDALVKLGKLSPGQQDNSKISTEEISKALGNVEISEQSNVSKVLNAVVEGSCEVGITYYSDTFGYEDKIKIIQIVPYSLTGDVIYPIAQVKNPQATEKEVKAAKNFVDFVLSSKDIFKSFYFDTDVQS